MHRNVGLAKRGLFCLAVLAAAILFAMLPGMMRAAHAEGDDTEIKTVDTSEDNINKQQYLNGYYKGKINKDSSAVREKPGSKDKATGEKKDDILKTSTGKQVLLKKGAEVIIFGEQSDSDADVWYHIQVTFEKEVFTGYVFSGRVTRENTQITFTPTPTEEPTATDTPKPTSALEEGDGKGELKEPTKAVDNKTSDMVKTAEDDSLGILKYVLILLAAFVAFIAVYMIVNHYAEKKIDDEMKLTSKRDDEIEQLEGESDEDFESARRKTRKKSVARDYKDQRQRKLSEELELDEEQNAEIDDFDNFKINMDGVFDDYTDTRESVSAAVTEAVTEDAREIEEVSSNIGRDVKSVEEWSAADDNLLRRLAENADAQEKEIIQQIAPNYVQSAAPAKPAATGDAASDEITFTPEEMILRRKLDELKEQDVLIHRKRGVGEVIDNSDPNIIQVRFDRDLCFLKKDKLVKKNLVRLQ